MKTKPKLILDTNMGDKILTNLSPDKASKIIASLNRDYKLCVSAETFLELLNGLIGGKNDEHFLSDVDKFRLIAGNGSPIFLAMPGAFALKTVLGISTSVSRFTPDRYAQCFRVLLAAQSLTTLRQGNVRLPPSTKRYGINLEMIAEMQQDGIKSHREWFEQGKTGTYSFPPSEVWAHLIGKGMGVDLTSE